MATHLFKSLTDEGRAQVAELLGTTGPGLDELDAAAVGSKLAALDEASQTAFMKAFTPLPGPPQSDLSSIARSLTQFDALAKSLGEAVEALNKTAEALATKAAAPVAVIAASGEAQLGAPAVDPVAPAALAAPAEAAATPGAPLVKGLTADDVRAIVTETMKGVLNKELEPAGEADAAAAPAGEPSQREQILALIAEHGPAGAFDAIFSPDKA